MSKASRAQSIAIAVMIAAFITAFAAVNFMGFEKFCTADMYEDTLVARLMWEQKTLFPSGWVFGNQFYVTATPVLAALFYGACSSINTAMALATTVMTALLAASFVWMVRPFASTRGIAAGLLALFCSAAAPDIVRAIEGQTMYLMCSYYAVYAVTYMFVLGDWLRERAGRYAGFINVPLVISAVLSFCAGMQSLRQTVIMALPLALCEAALWVADAVKEKRIAFPLRRRHTLRAFVVCIANLCGAAVIRLIDPPHFAMYGSGALNGWETVREKLGACVSAVRGAAGLGYLSGPDASLPIGLVGAGLTLCVIAAIALCVSGASKGGLRQAAAVSAVSIAVLFAVSALTDVYVRRIYFFVWYPLAAVCVTMLAEKLGKDVFKGAFIACICALAALNLYFGYLPCVRDALAPDVTNEAMASRWIEGEGYELVYGDWLTTCPIAARSDGAFIAGTWHDEVFSALRYINPLDIYGEEDNDRAVICLRDWNRDRAYELAERQGAGLTELARFGDIGIYRSTKQLMRVSDGEIRLPATE